MASNGTDRAFQLIELGRWAEARTLFDEALAADPGDTWAALGSGWCHAHFGNKTRALELAQQAAPAATGSAAMWIIYVRILRSAGKKKPTLEAAREGVRLFPHHPSAHQSLAEAAADARKKKEAFAAATRMVELQPYSANAHVTHSFVALKFSDYKTAEHASRKALEVEPNNRSALNNLSVALNGQRKRKEAIEISSRLAAQNPHDKLVVTNARSQFIRFGLMPLGVLGYAVVQLAAHSSGLGWNNVVMLIGLAVMIFGGITMVRMYSLPEQQRKIAQRLYRQKWYGFLLREPLLTIAGGAVVLAAGVGLSY